MAVDKNRPLQSGNTESEASGSANSIEKFYPKLSLPDFLVEKQTQTLWVYENNEMVHRSVSYVPGLLYIFDEILVNAADTKQRDSSMNSLKVTIDVEQNLICVLNNGSGVPVTMHQKEGFYDYENIFFTEFVIETAAVKRELKFKPVFHNNFEKKSDYVTGCEGSENWTKVSFRPDLAKFNMTELDADAVALMKKRVVDMAGTLGKSVKVELNGKCIPVNSFTDYVSLYLQAACKSRSDEDDLPRIAEKLSDGWEVCVSISEGQFQQVSFVNGVATVKGGTHVDYVTNQISNHLMAFVKKNTIANITAHTVKNSLWVFVNSMIDNPAFDSLTKETLTTCPNNFASKCELSAEFLKKVEKSGVVVNILQSENLKQSEGLNSAGGKSEDINFKRSEDLGEQSVTEIERLVDANEAGGKNADKCTLILTAGRLVKSFALSGISAIGRDHYGVYSLRKKLLSVSNARYDLLLENKEIQHIKQILGLEYGKEYHSVKSLRYGHLMIMTNQDPDGSHFKGMIIYIIHSFWPSLLKIPSFLVEFIKPIAKATHSDGTAMPLHSIPMYESWREGLGGNASSWTINYYQGLRSRPEDVEEYFSHLDEYKKYFVWKDERDDSAIKLAFSSNIEERKDWLRQFEPGTYLDRKEPTSFRDFVYKELILFPMESLQQVIPSMVDGLKPCERKILFCCLKSNFVEELRVPELATSVIHHAAYDHGHENLPSAIIGMAQNVVGSNNINLLHAAGRLGSHHGPRDHWGVLIKLSPITRYLFHKDDDNLLHYLIDKYSIEHLIEPTWYMPVIPTVLVNGSEGAGTEWSTYIPKYNPKDIVANTRRCLNDEPMEPMVPWYKGFRGTIEKSDTKEGSYISTGIIKVINKTTVRVTELPVGKCTEEYMKWLCTKLIGHENAVEPFIQKISVYKTVHIDITLSSEEMAKVKPRDLPEKFNLTTEITTSNMHLFDSKGVIKKYDTPEQIIEEFCNLRRTFYKKRKYALYENLLLELLKLKNMTNFIEEVLERNILNRADVSDDLRKGSFAPLSMAGASSGAGSDCYDYLLSLDWEDFTAKQVQQLYEEMGAKYAKLYELRLKHYTSFWIEDLNALDRKLDEQNKGDETGIPRKNSTKKRKFRETSSSSDIVMELKEARQRGKLWLI